MKVVAGAILAAIGVVLLVWVFSRSGVSSTQSVKSVIAESNMYTITVNDIDKQRKMLSDYSNKVSLVVNVATY